MVECEVQGEVEAKKVAYAMLVERTDQEDKRKNKEKYKATKK